MSTPDGWLRATLARNAHCAYLRGRAFGELPIVTYDDLVPWIDRIVAGESDVLINPDLRAFWVLEFWNAAGMIEEGRRAAEAALPAIRAKLDELHKEGP